MGSGYVGMSLAVLLAQHNEVVVLDVDASRIEVQSGSYLGEDDIVRYKDRYGRA